ncbi:MAG: PorV/PorQ family protein [candidate division KSB1 bacterium]|nr:PorV/PorQ family protein [candidate division KSB1 bacterium]
MKTTHRSLAWTLAILLLSVHGGYGKEMKKVAQAGMKWLAIPLGGRASSLGGAYTAMPGGVSSIFWNPSGTAFGEGRNVFLSQAKWIADITVNAAAVTCELGRWGVMGASFVSVDWGTLYGTRRANTPEGFIETGEFSPENWMVGLSYALRVSDRFAFGGHLKYVHEKLGSNLEGFFANPKEFTAEMNVPAFDFGTIYYTGFKDLRLAMSLQNFSQEKKYRAEHFALPLTLRFGMAMDVSKFVLDSPNHSLTFCVDALHPRDYSERLLFGLEYAFDNMFFLRGGYKTNYDEEDISFGAGLNYNLGGVSLVLDYGYIRFSHFDAAQIFSFGFKF